MESYMLACVPQTAVLTQGMHEPDALVRGGGVWIHAAGSLALGAGHYALRTHDQWVWLAVKSGEATLSWQGTSIALSACQMCFLPAGEHAAALIVDARVHCLWFALEGPQAAELVSRMGAPLSTPMCQRALPCEMTAGEQIVHAACRCPATADASYHLAQLTYGMLCAHWGQNAVSAATVSPEIERVVDALRAAHFRENPSLSDMAQIAAMPTETFRKRFLSEMGLPPVTYLLHCKMERAKEILREPGATVGQAGAQVGMQDPYRFSKQFKSIVGISPSEFIRRSAPDGENMA